MRTRSPRSTWTYLFTLAALLAIPATLRAQASTEICAQNTDEIRECLSCCLATFPPELLRDCALACTVDAGIIPNQSQRRAAIAKAKAQQRGRGRGRGGGVRAGGQNGAPGQNGQSNRGGSARSQEHRRNQR